MIGHAFTVNNNAKYKKVWVWPFVYNLGFIFLGHYIDKDNNLSFFGYETSSGHEGLVFQMNGFEIGKTYTFDMDYQFPSASFFGNTSYSVGCNVFTTLADATCTASNYSANWGIPGNMVRDTQPHSLSITWTATQEIYYLGFAMNGIADSGQNYLRCTNMHVI